MLFDLREGPEVPPLIAAFRMSYVSRNPLRSLRGHRLAFLELAGAQKLCVSGCEYPSLMAVFPMGYFSRSPPLEKDTESTGLILSELGGAPQI